MADGQGAQPPADLQAQLADWITIWHSELASMATDRELQETWVRLVGLWAQTAERAARLLPAPATYEPTPGPTRTTPPPGATPAVAPPDARDATINRLAERVAELERRLADLVRAGEPEPKP
jgi:hypothetical protein